MLSRSLTATALLVVSLLPSRAIETPEHAVVTQDGKFEARDYPAMTLVRTPMGDGDFMRLFQFISGGNTDGAKIAMTAPVLTRAEGDFAGMSFILPRAVAAGRVPAPAGGPLTVETMEPARFAVFTFKGGRSAANEEAALASLRGWMDARGLAAAGPPFFAYYDPPWIPGFLRRNEVMVPVDRGRP